MSEALIRLLKDTKDDLVWLATGDGFKSLSEGERSTIYRRIGLIEDGLSKAKESDQREAP